MDLSFTPEEEAFQADVRSILASELPPDIAAKARSGRRLGKAGIERWQAILNKRGWLAPHWPVEHGGAGWSAVQRYIFELEMALAQATGGRRPPSRTLPGHGAGWLT
jgi:alkylation response protein AidB-like acyl-CoA dehydrogenase